mgnify:CR=1 FL=1
MIVLKRFPFRNLKKINLIFFRRAIPLRFQLMMDEPDESEIDQDGDK